MTGRLADGNTFEEETVVRHLSIQGAFVQLNHTPKLQSKLQVAIPGLGGPEGHEDLVLCGHVARLEPTACPDKIGADILFTE